MCYILVMTKNISPLDCGSICWCDVVKYCTTFNQRTDQDTIPLLLEKGTAALFMSVMSDLYLSLLIIFSSLYDGPDSIRHTGSQVKEYRMPIQSIVKSNPENTFKACFKIPKENGTDRCGPTGEYSLHALFTLLLPWILE